MSGVALRALAHIKQPPRSMQSLFPAITSSSSYPKRWNDGRMSLSSFEVVSKAHRNYFMLASTSVSPRLLKSCQRSMYVLLRLRLRLSTNSKGTTGYNMSGVVPPPPPPFLPLLSQKPILLKRWLRAFVCCKSSSCGFYGVLQNFGPHPHVRGAQLVMGEYIKNNYGTS
jgi:hypothetical protein